MRAKPRLLGSAALIALGLTSAGNVRAQSAQDKAAADVLFQQGKKLIQEGKYSEACPKFAESLRLDTGIGTMLWLADCYERSGKTASAWGQFQEAAETAARTKDAREKVAHARAQQLEPKLIKLQIVVPQANEVPGLDVKRDGTVLGKPLWGTPVPVDPGGHAVSAAAPHFKTWDGSVDASGEGRTLTITIPKLTEDTGGAVAGAPKPGGEAKTDRGNTQRVIGLVVAGVGVVGAGLGVVFGVSAKSSLDDSNANGHCLPNNHCDQTGFQARSDAKNAATLSTVSFALGAVAIGAGAALFFTAPKNPPKSAVIQGVRVTPAIGPRGGGIGLEGTF